MNLRLIKKIEPKKYIGVLIYTSIYSQLEAMCTAEKIRLSDLLRSLVNDALEEYETKKTCGQGSRGQE